MTSSGKQSLREVVHACMEDDISEEEMRLVKEMMEHDEIAPEILDAISGPEEEQDYEELEEMLGEDGISDIVVCPSCGTMLPVENEKCPFCGKKVDADVKGWGLYRSISPGKESDKELIFTYSDYENGRYIFLERISSAIYVKYRLMEVFMLEKLRSPVVRIYENIGLKGGV